ncbi:RNA binding S1 domain protein [Streptomyces albus]|uniref:RNA binding S1 domain protein n=1 Tax=Streptomyces albus (strain ATCC 21838 / DSM 41398 / FERM P-419 / JCM 4703 / NBRC 107858) TaxID=1081613 RepID=A0A0B5EGC0_STRA4|nr:RNA binding S1 domain protein [Streptomyces albus]AOU75452.1 RNA binding S1 domain protein [Streptomyces albus]AYN31256.1 RNA-binding protein [Streptomyces albus]
MPSFVHRISKYDPADRDERGAYTGAEEPVSDHGPVESAYLEALAAFAAATGVDRLALREPGLTGLVHFGLEPVIEGQGLTGLFPPDLRGFHDGAEVSLATALELVRAMLRDNGVWCRLEVADVFAVHVGWDQYVYVTSEGPCESALARTRELGLFPERIAASPYAAEYGEPGEQRPADEEFWARVRWCLIRREEVLLEESPVENVSRWYRLTAATLDGVRAGLTPRARLALWPKLSEDVAAVLAAVPAEGTVELVWEDGEASLTSAFADRADTSGYPVLAARVARARAAAVLPLEVDARRPLFTAVLPDGDGVLRARWRTEPTPSDRTWALLRTLRKGQTVRGTVTGIASFGVTFVDIGGLTAMINIPELSWRPLGHPSEAVAAGEEITAEVLDVDPVRERVALSLRALRPDPLPGLRARVGQVVTGVVTKLVPLGAFVRVEDRPDGFQGLVPRAELPGEALAGTGEMPRVGDPLRVRILDVDLDRRRIALSAVRARGDGDEDEGKDKDLDLDLDGDGDA